VAVPVSGARRIAIISRKGGIGKTTTTLMLGHTFASHREDRVVALDGNPDAGSLTYRIPRETTNNMLDLLTARGDLTRYSDMRAFTNRTNTRLEVLAAVEDPRISEALGERDYRRVCELLAYHYCLTCMDTGTGMLESAERGIFDLADQAVLVLGTSVDSARTAASTLDWLEENGHEDLVDDAVCVINSVTGKAAVGMDRIDRHFRARCREVVRIPWDPHLSVGAEAELGQLRPSTRAAYLELAAAVSDGF
jgi:putative peptide zinc metalloprotease protein